jgi:AdoMet-dependent heme synthase
MCFSNSDPTVKGKNELSLDKIKDILNQCAALGVVSIIIGGGEPLIREDIFDILRFAKQNGLIITFVTNGSLLTAEKAKLLKEILDFRFDKIQVSLDGSTARIHEKQRGVKGIYKKTIKGMEALREQGMKYTVCTVATRINFDNIPAIIKLAERKGADIFRMMHLQPFGKAGDFNTYRKMKLSFAQECTLLEFIQRKREELNHLHGRIHISEENGFVFRYNHHFFRTAENHDGNVNRSWFSCSAGTSTMSIGPTGQVAACTYFHPFPELAVGNVNVQSLEDIWNNEDVFEKFRNVTDIKGKCRTCDYLNSCRGGCFALTYALTKEIGVPDPFCNLHEDKTIFVS